MPGIEDALQQVSGVEGYAVDPTRVLVSPEMAAVVSDLHAASMPDITPGGIDGDEDKLAALQSVFDDLNSDAETIRTAVNDFALPGLQAAAAEQQAAASSPTAALSGAASGGSSEQLLTTASEMFQSISAESGLSSGDSDDAESKSGPDGESEDTDDSEADRDDSDSRSTSSDSDTPDDVGTTVSSAMAPPAPAPMPSVPGMAPNPGGLLSALASGGTSPSPAMGTQPSMVSSMAAPAPSQVPTQTSTTGSGSGSGITRSEMDSMLREAKNRIDSSRPSTPASSGASSPGSSSSPSPSTPSTTSLSSTAPPASSGSSNSPSPAPSGSSSRSEAPAGPATGRTVSGGSVDQSQSTGRGTPTTLSASSGGSGSSAPAGGGMRGGMGGMGMMPPMMPMGGSGSGSGSGGSDRLSQYTSTNPVLNGQWAKKNSISGGVIRTGGRHRAPEKQPDVLTDKSAGDRPAMVDLSKKWAV